MSPKPIYGEAFCGKPIGGFGCRSVKTQALIEGMVTVSEELDTHLNRELLTVSGIYSLRVG